MSRDRGRPGSRQAFTLVEMVLIGSFSVVILGMVYSGFLSGSRQSLKLDLDQQSVHAIQILVESLRRDLAEAVPARNLDPALADASRPGEPASELRFLRQRGHDDPEPVHWRFDGTTGSVERNGRALAAVRFERVTFRVVDTGSGPTLEIVASYRPQAVRTPGSRGGSVARRVFALSLPLDPPIADFQFPWAARL